MGCHQSKLMLRDSWRKVWAETDERGQTKHQEESQMFHLFSI